MRGMLCAGVMTLALCQAAQAENLFVGDWSRAVQPGAGTWRYLQTMRSDSMTIEVDPTHPVSGARVAHFTVRPGDKVGGWSGERSEVAMMQDAKGRRAVVTAQSGREFYGISVKVPAGWQPPERDSNNHVWGIFFQLHGPDNLAASPSLSFQLQSEFGLGLHGGGLYRNRRGGVHAPSGYPFTDGALNPGRWVQFLMDVKWSADDQGAVVIWRRDQGAKDFAKVLELHDISNLQYGLDQPLGDHYWKTGFYRSDGRRLTHEVWIGPVVRGTNRDEVAKAAFGRP